MNTVTKSGTNSLHGTLFEFYRNQGLDATNYMDGTKAALKQHQFGGVLGGPIWKDKTFFFLSYEGARLRLPQTHTIQVPSEYARSQASSAVKQSIGASQVTVQRNS